MYTPVNPSLLYKSGVQGGSTLYRHVFVMNSQMGMLEKERLFLRRY